MKTVLSLTLLFILICVGFTSQAQFSTTVGNHNIEFTGVVYPIFNYRFRSGHDWNSFSNNVNPAVNMEDTKFGLRSAMIQIEGRVGKTYEYQLQYNFAAQPQADVENQALMDAWLAYKGLKAFNIKFGYMKLPYSRTSMASFTYLPFIQRAELARGEAFGRRDVGLLLYQDYWNQRINAYAGVYSGAGEAILIGENDRGGKLEYVARVDVSWPSRMRYRELDLNVSPEPIFQLGANYRNNTRINAFANDSVRYGLTKVQGNRQMWGLDFAAFYKGWSFNAEWHQLQVTPLDSSKTFGGNTTPDFFGSVLGATRVFNAGGAIVQLAYFNPKWKSAFAVRYDRFNSNDLVGPRQGNTWSSLAGYNLFPQYDSRATQESLTFGYNYLINGWSSVIRVQYNMRLRLDETKFNTNRDQVRIGWQYIFN